MSEKSDSPGIDDQLTPSDALIACRHEYGLEDEGQWIFDVRAGFLQLYEVTPCRIMVVTENDHLILVGTAVDLYKMCRSGSVHPVQSAAIAEAYSIVHTLATQQIEEIVQHRELNDAWSPTDSATSVADAKAAVHFFEQALAHDCSPDEFLSKDIHDL